MPTAGELDRRVTFRRRVEQVANAGNVRGGYTDFFKVWAGYRPVGSRERLAYGIAEDVVQAILTVRESSQVAQLNNADRVTIGSDDFQIVSVPVKDRSGYRKIVVRRAMRA